MKYYSVWVGGVEVYDDDYYLSYKRATELARGYIEDGYDDVIIKLIEKEE